MRQKQTWWQGRIGAGMAVSLALHLVIGAVLLIDMPFTMPETDPEESVAVEIVPPPEETIEEAPAPEAAPEEPKKPPAEQAQPPETEPEEAEEAAQEEPAAAAEGETSAEPVAEPPPPATAAAEPPAPEPPPEEQAAEPEAAPEPEPATEQEAAAAEDQSAEDQSAEDQSADDPPPSPEQGRGQPLPVLRPVFEFGEKDGGPREARDGNASQEEATEQAEKPVADTQEPPDETTPQEAAGETPPPEAPEGTDMAMSASDGTDAAAEAGDPVPDGIAAPEVDFGDPAPGQTGAGGLEDSGRAGVLAMPRAGTAETPSPVTPTAAGLTEAKRLYSPTATDDPVATTAMRNLPRDLRAGQLCATELREQLVRASPGYRPEMLPSYKLPKGTVMDARKAAFRSEGKWYDLRFVCEVDDKVTKVVSFAFEVGDPVPRSQWDARRFPSF